MSLYPSLLPYPAACAASILNTDCANVMSDLCAVSNQSGVSKLLDGSSNCSVWKYQLEEYHDIEPGAVKNLMGFLDAAITKYCSGAFGGNGLYSNECSCLNMPLFAKDSCAAQTCGGDPQDCLGKNFARYNNGLSSCNNNTCTTYSGTYVNISFPECIPQTCWNQQCWNPDTLLKTAQRDLQKNCISGICVSIIGTDTITTPAADPTAFQPSSFITRCGSGPVDGYPIYIPTVWNIAVDNTANIPSSIANGGNQGTLLLRYIKTANYKGIDIGAQVPEEITIASGGRSVFNVSFNQALLYLAWKQATNADQTANVTVKDYPQCWVSGDTPVPCALPSNTIVSPIFYYEYYSHGVRQIFSFTVQLVLNPPVGTQQRNPANPIVMNKEIPRGVNIFAGVALFFFFLTWVFYVTATRRAAMVLNS